MLKAGIWERFPCHVIEHTDCRHSCDPAITSRHLSPPRNTTVLRPHLQSWKPTSHLEHRAATMESNGNPSRATLTTSYTLLPKSPSSASLAQQPARVAEQTESMTVPSQWHHIIAHSIYVVLPLTVLTVILVCLTSNGPQLDLLPSPQSSHGGGYISDIALTTLLGLAAALAAVAIPLVYSTMQLLTWTVAHSILIGSGRQTNSPSLLTPREFALLNGLLAGNVDAWWDGLKYCVRPLKYRRARCQRQVMAATAILTLTMLVRYVW